MFPGPRYCFTILQLKIVEKVIRSLQASAVHEMVWWKASDLWRMGVLEEQHHIYVWREQAIIEWSWRGTSADINLWTFERSLMTSVRGEWSRCVNSIVACCHKTKLCAHAARVFWSQQGKGLDLGFRIRVRFMATISLWQVF